MLLNTKGWVFDDAEPRYTIGLTAICRARPTAKNVRLRGPFADTSRYDEGMAKASSENKTILIDFYADWCYYCKEMDEETYSDTEVIEKSRSFICIKVDGDDNAELLEYYNVEAYPTTVFLYPNGTEIDRIVGYVDKDVFLDKMNEVLAE